MAEASFALHRAACATDPRQGFMRAGTLQTASAIRHISRELASRGIQTKLTSTDGRISSELV